MRLFEKFNLIVNACFGNQLNANYKQYIIDFFEEVKCQNIPMTNKMHVLQFHVDEFIIKHNCSLGVYSEQAIEAVHYDFEKFKAKYVGHCNKENINLAQLRSVCAYNAGHL